MFKKSFAYVFGRDGGLTKVDILTREIVARTMQAGNSIGGAISDDGIVIAGGIEGSERVVLPAGGFLAPGDRVRPVREGAAQE